MPEISRFFGIIVYMYWEINAKHHVPHFHALYNEYECVYSLPDFNILSGKLSGRAEKLLLTWARLNRNELMENWEFISHTKPLKKIKPLE
ncbi:MAG: DUF4160 domain-containing protein [bacterium]